MYGILAGNKQHTFIETETVRYVYQPIENLFLLLVTNKASNIVEDLETLRMLSKGMIDDGTTATTEGRHLGAAPLDIWLYPSRFVMFPSAHTAAHVVYSRLDLKEALPARAYA